MMYCRCDEMKMHIPYVRAGPRTERVRAFSAACGKLGAEASKVRETTTNDLIGCSVSDRFCCTSLAR